MRYEGVIFDLDGTLVNSLDDIADSMNRVLEDHGFPTHETEAYKYFIGNGLKNLVRKALPGRCREEDLVSRYFDLMMKEYSHHCIDKTKPYDGIAQLLNELTDRKLKLAIFSNKVDDLTQKVVREVLTNWKFEVILGSSPNIPRKPNPMGALLISEQIGIQPERLIYLGDTDVDMKTANQAGMYAVGVLWGFRTREELISNGAKELLGQPLELLDVLV